MKRWIIVIVSLLVVAAGAWFAWKKWGHREKPTVYRTVKVERDAVVQIVRATGTVQPVKLVQVGTQVNGIVLKLNADFNSRVKAGDVVAQIDPRWPSATCFPKPNSTPPWPTRPPSKRS